MAEIHDWQDYTGEDGEFTPIEEPAAAEVALKEEHATVPAQRSGNFIRRHPYMTTLAGIAVAYWCGVFGSNEKGSLYHPIQPTKGSVFVSNTKNGSEFITPLSEASKFYCGKRVAPLQNDTDFKKDVEIMPQDSYTRYVHITCEGADSWTPIEWPKKTDAPSPLEQDPYSPYSQEYPNTPEPEYYESTPSDPA